MESPEGANMRAAGGILYSIYIWILFGILMIAAWLLGSVTQAGAQTYTMKCWHIWDGGSQDGVFIPAIFGFLLRFEKLEDGGSISLD
jgi:hypothetical protein